MEAIFLQLLNMSITASWLVLAVVILRLLLKKAPRALFCVMWGLVALRLLCPVSFESIFSLIPSVETVPQDIATSDVPMIESGMTFVDNTINPILTDTITPNVTASINPMQIMTSVASIVWIAGMAVMLLYMVISYLRVYFKVRESIKVDKNIFICDRIDTPFIFGFFRPRIYLPSAMQEGDKEYVIAHEKAHLSRHDHWWKPLGYILLTVYWLNPILWVAYILLCKDIELACDEKVIRQLGVESKKSYADALINCSAPRKMITACPLAFGETGVKNRIKSVLNYKKPAFWIILIALVACVVISVCFLTNPASVKLTQIDDGHGTDQFGKLFVSKPSITLVQGEQECLVENRAPVFEELEKIKVRTKPISISRSEDRAKDNTIILNAGTGHEFYLYFNQDFTEYWINDLVKPSQTYKVQNPSVVRNIFETYMQEDAEGTESPTLSPQPNQTEPNELLWYDRTRDYDTMWHGTGLQKELPEYPGITFQMIKNNIEVIEDGETTVILDRTPMENAFWLDITKDGKRDLCITANIGSGIIDTRIIVYDYATKQRIELADRGEYDYTLSLYQNQLYVTKSVYQLDEAIAVGNLNCTMKNEEPVLEMSNVVPAGETNPGIIPSRFWVDGGIYFYQNDDEVDGQRVIEQIYFMNQEDQTQLVSMLDALEWTSTTLADHIAAPYSGKFYVNGVKYAFGYSDGEIFNYETHRYCRDTADIMQFLKIIQSNSGS